MEIMVATTAGLFSLLGASAGAALNRRTDYERWLRERRSEVFAKFLGLLANARKNATEALFDKSMETLQQEIKVTEAYLLPLEYKRVVCLYLPKEEQQEFRRLVREYFSLHISRELGDSRQLSMTKKNEIIQKIFGANL